MKFENKAEETVSSKMFLISNIVVNSKYVYNLTLCRILLVWREQATERGIKGLPLSKLSKCTFYSDVGEIRFPIC